MLWVLGCPLKTHVLRFGSRVARGGVFKRRALWEAFRSLRACL